jgi:hypothetical protein
MQRHRGILQRPYKRNSPLERLAIPRRAWNGGVKRHESLRHRTHARDLLQRRILDVGVQGRNAVVAAQQVCWDVGADMRRIVAAYRVDGGAGGAAGGEEGGYEDLGDYACRVVGIVWLEGG